MKFIADAMLGRLARWLRLLGFDVLYYPMIADSRIVSISREDDRIVLTRDTGLIKRAGLKSPVLIESEEISGQLNQMVKLLDFRYAAPLGRCAVCNGLLTRAERDEDVRNTVPDHVYHTHTDFARCTNCGRIYWQGTHYRNFMEKAGRILKADSEN